jgi:hypothetical protein
VALRFFEDAAGAEWRVGNVRPNGRSAVDPSAVLRMSLRQTTNIAQVMIAECGTTRRGTALTFTLARRACLPREGRNRIRPPFPRPPRFIPLSAGRTHRLL